jgi:hypothetical protein
MKLRKVRIGGIYQEDSKKPETKPEENAMADVNKWMIDSSDAVVLLIDHQSGLFQLVKDMQLCLPVRTYGTLEPSRRDEFRGDHERPFVTPRHFRKNRLKVRKSFQEAGS